MCEAIAWWFRLLFFGFVVYRRETFMKAWLKIDPSDSRVSITWVFYNLSLSLNFVKSIVTASVWVDRNCWGGGIFSWMGEITPWKYIQVGHELHKIWDKHQQSLGDPRSPYCASSSMYSYH